MPLSHLFTLSLICHGSEYGRPHGVEVLQDLLIRRILGPKLCAENVQDTAKTAKGRRHVFQLSITFGQAQKRIAHSRVARTQCSGIQLCGARERGNSNLRVIFWFKVVFIIQFNLFGIRRVFDFVRDIKRWLLLTTFGSS